MTDPARLATLALLAAAKVPLGSGFDLAAAVEVMRRELEAEYHRARADAARDLAAMFAPAEEHR